MEIIEVKPHDREPVCYLDNDVYKIFLAGTIDNGESEDWQKLYVEDMKKIADGINKDNPNNDFVIIIYNPRRDNWDLCPSDYEMKYQINWELDHLESSDLIYMNILPDSKSPISLMEIGLFASKDKLKVVCPKEFYRYDNVKVVCDRYKIPLINKKGDKWPELKTDIL